MIVPDKRNVANKKKYGKANPPRAQPKRPVKRGTDSAIEKAAKKVGADVKELLKKPAEWFESLDKKKWLLTNYPYLLIGCAVDKVAWL